MNKRRTKWTFIRDDMHWYLIPDAMVEEFNLWTEARPDYKGTDFYEYRSASPDQYVFEVPEQI